KAKKLATPIGRWGRRMSLHAKCSVTVGLAQKMNRPTFCPPSQVLTRLSRRLALSIVLTSAVATTVIGCRQPPADSRTPGAPPALRRGGAIVASVRNEFRSFNRLAARDTATALVATLTQAKLVRINQATQELEPWLAESWTTTPDLRHATLKLRQNVQFSDGHPFTADDVVFTFDAAYDGQ